MSREKRLSPRRAQSLAFLFLLGRTQVRLIPLLFLRPHPPKGGTPSRETPRFGPFQSTLFGCSLTLEPGLQPGFVLVPRRGPERKSTVCGLNRFLPSAEPDGSLYLNPRPVSQSSRLLPSGPFCAVSTGELPFPVWKEKLQCKPIFLSNSGIDRFLESKRKAQPGPAEAATAS